SGYGVGACGRSDAGSAPQMPADWPVFLDRRRDLAGRIRTAERSSAVGAMPVLQQRASLDEAGDDPGFARALVRSAGNRRLFPESHGERSACRCGAEARAARVLSPDGAQMAGARRGLSLSVGSGAAA